MDNTFVKSGVTVRRSRPQDIPFIVAELKQFSKFFGTRRPMFPKDDEVALGIITRMMDDHLFFTSENDGQLSGFISGFVTSHPFNPEIVQLTETFWWVSQKYRMTKAGALLLDAYLEWGKENTDWVTMTLEADSPVSCGPLLKRGFKLKETSYLLECK